MYALLSFSMRKSRSTRRMGVMGINWNGDGLISTVSFVGVHRSLVPYRDNANRKCHDQDKHGRHRANAAYPIHDSSTASEGEVD